MLYISRYQSGGEIKAHFQDWNELTQGKHSDYHGFWLGTQPVIGPFRAVQIACQLDSDHRAPKTTPYEKRGRTTSSAYPKLQTMKTTVALDVLSDDATQDEIDEWVRRQRMATVILGEAGWWEQGKRSPVNLIGIEYAVELLAQMRTKEM